MIQKIAVNFRVVKKRVSGFPTGVENMGGGLFKIGLGGVGGGGGGGLESIHGGARR